MKVMTRAKSKTDAAKDGRASTIRAWIEGRGSTVRDTRRQARQSLQDVRRHADRQVTRARIASAKARAQGRAKASGISAKAMGAVGAAALVAGYFLDPDSGRRRRNVVRDRVSALITKSKTAPETPATNDQALAERVKSEISQPADAPQGSVNVNVEDGVVYLRGEVKGPDQIRRLIEEAGAVDGVRGVENLLHAA